MRLEVEVALRAEAAAEERHDDADVGLGNAERVRDPGAGDVGHLRRRPDRDPVALPLRDDRARLDRDALRRVGDVAAADDDVGRCERGVDVALHDRREAEHVVVAAERLVALVRLPVRDARAARRRRAPPRSRSRTGSGSRSTSTSAAASRAISGVSRGDPGDDVALEADGVAREEPPVLHHAAVEDVGDVLVRDDGDHARERPRLRGVDPRDPRVRVVGVAERRVELAREREVGRVPARARSPSRARPGGRSSSRAPRRRSRRYPTTPGTARGRAVQSSAVAASYKLVWFVPASHLQATRDAVFVAGAGWIGDYSRCSWATLGEGTFLGGEGTQPAVGEAGPRRDRGRVPRRDGRPAEKLAAVVDCAPPRAPVRGAARSTLRARRAHEGAALDGRGRAREPRAGRVRLRPRGRGRDGARRARRGDRRRDEQRRRVLGARRRAAHGRSRRASPSSRCAPTRS